MAELFHLKLDSRYMQQMTQVHNVAIIVEKPQLHGITVHG